MGFCAISQPLCWLQYAVPCHLLSCLYVLVGDDVPKGRDAVGWHIAVYWKDDKTFYGGEIIDFENSTGRHKVRAGASAVLGWPRSPLYAVICAHSVDIAPSTAKTCPTNHAVACTSESMLLPIASHMCAIYCCTVPCCSPSYDTCVRRSCTMMERKSGCTCAMSV